MFRAHRVQVYALALRLTNDPDIAEEIVLDAFVSAWNGLAEFRGDSRFSTWVSSIAVNHSRRARRTRSRRRRRFEPLDRSGEGARAADGRAPRVEERIDIERAIAGLPDGAREALLLRHVHGLSCAEAATVLKVSVGTVKSQTSRACALLRERLQHD